MATKTVCRGIASFPDADIHLSKIRSNTTIDEKTGCWEWTGRVNQRGYAEVMIQKRHLYVHRVSFVIHHRPLQNGELVLHKCDNTRCCNPAHLYAGSYADNAKDAMARGRNTRGELQAASRLTDDLVLAMRRLAATGMTLCEIARRYNETRHTVWKVVRGKRWAHLPGAVPAALTPAAGADHD